MDKEKNKKLKCPYCGGHHIRSIIMSLDVGDEVVYLCIDCKKWWNEKKGKYDVYPNKKKI